MSKLMTLVTDPFEDDAISILEWAYGQNARQLFIEMRGGGVQRVGQAFMNVLHVCDVDEYKRILGSLVDPFNQDKCLPMAIDKLTSK